MKPRLVAIYLLIVLLPLGLLSWLGSELARDEQQRVEMKFQELLTAQLADRNQTFINGIEEREREFLEMCNVAEEVSRDELRALIRKERFVRQIFVLKPDGGFIYPLLVKDATERERGFFERTKSIWESGIRLGARADSPVNFANNTAQTFKNQALPLMQGGSVRQQHGWHPWFWGNGVQFLFWRQFESGRVVGVEVDRMALISDLVSKLPATRENDPSAIAGRIMLRDAQNNPLYQWGSYDPATDEKAVARLQVVAPLSMWSMEYFAAPSVYPADFGRSTLFNVVTALVAGCLVMLLLAFYFYRENTREIREATQRVSFVNQVSHELKTPLTNIRMYAELLKTQLDALDEPATDAGENLGVIVNESQRLSRMINNVLTFAKGQRGQLSPNKRPVVPDEVIKATIDHFRPALAARDIGVDFVGDASSPVELDPDYLGQILGNLLSNVEKYAPRGGTVTVSSERGPEFLKVMVADEGDGIPDSQRATVFQPFTRLSNQLSDGITGTGIGLSISRDLARNHGGDLTLGDSVRGALFRMSLAVQPVPQAS